MRKTALLMLCLLMGINTFAQTEGPRQSLGVNVGFTRPTFRTGPEKNDKKLPYVTAMNGVKVGLVYDATLIKGFGFSLGINYAFSDINEKWKDVPQPNKYQKTREKWLLHTIEVPIDWQYKFEIAKESWLILYTGPTIQYHFNFKEKEYGQMLDKSQLPQMVYTTETIKDISHYHVDNDNDGINDYTPLNIMWGVGAGFQFQNYYIRGGYDFGIYNPYKDRICNVTSDTQYRNVGRFDGWNIKVGIYFLNF